MSAAVNASRFRAFLLARRLTASLAAAFTPRSTSRLSSRSTLLFTFALVLALDGLASTPAQAAYAIAQYGAPKYPPDFTHFDSVNPDAPKRGTLVLANPDRKTSFDKFNPFTLRGNSAPGVDMTFETLTVGSDNETSSAYGLLADDIRVAPDQRSVTFHINTQARFSNGDPVTAADVKYSFDTLMSPQAAPTFRVYFGDIAGVVIVDPQTIRFDFKNRNPQLPLLAGSVPVFSPKWGMLPNGQRVAFDKLAFEVPIGSGPYLIDHYDSGRDITYRLNPDYWGRNLPTRRGMYNFTHVTYKLYADNTARLEAFKAGEFDAVVEYIARNWARLYTGRKFNDGELIKTEFVHHNGAGMQGFVLNLRRPLFQDVRVRQALDLAMDFEWMNRQIFFSQYRRIDSYFSNSRQAATGMPSAGELALLEPLRAQLDPAVFGPMVTQPQTDPPSSLRENLRRARALLAQAGWVYRDGALRNAQGQAFTLEILDDSGSAQTMGPVVSPYARNLAKLGITVNFRTTDFALYQKRLDDFDFDVTTARYPDDPSPGNELLDRFGSASANTHGSDNLIGLHSPAIDALTLDVLRARTPADLESASQALDRVLMHGYYVVPQWYSSTHRVAYRKTLAHPATLPLYYTAEDWIIRTWWDNAPGH